MPELAPQTEAEAVELIAAAMADKTRMTIVGGGTRAGLGRPPEGDTLLSTKALRGVTLYEPAEMVLGARAGTPLAEVEALLAAHGQRLAFEPMDHRPLLDSTGEPSLGAIAACNVSGPRRVTVGAARDHLVGVRFINGRGEAVKSGGRAMKNVTGLDLVKLSAGAFGTLGLLTEVVFKVMPVPETTDTLVFSELADDVALRLLGGAMASPFEVTGAAHLPAGTGGPAARTLLRLEGFSASLAYRAERLRMLFAEHGAADLLQGDAALALWRSIRDVTVLAEPRTDEIWRVHVAPSKGAAFMRALGEGPAFRHYFDWAGGLIWLAAPASADAAARIRAATAPLNGHAMLVRAAAARRAEVEVFEPLAGPLMRLTAGIKASIDPDGIFNFGRMYRGL